MEVRSRTYSLGSTLLILLFVSAFGWLWSLDVDFDRFSIADALSKFAAGWVLLVALPFAIVIVHEFVHALAGWLVGAPVYEIRIGWGKQERAFRLGRLRLTYASQLSGGGYCVVGPPRRSGRWRRLAIWGAPLSLHVAAAVALGPSMVLHFGTGGHMALHLFYAYNLWDIVVNAVPRDFNFQGHVLPNDGKALITILRRPAEVAKWEMAQRLIPAYYAYADGDYATYLRLAQEMGERHAADPWVQLQIGTGYWMTEQFEKALEFVPEVAANWSERETQTHTPEQIEEHGIPVGAYERVVRALLYAYLERYDDAVREFGAGLEAETAEERRATWRAFVAYVHYLARDSAGAAPARAAYATIPWSSWVAGVHAIRLVESGEPERALEVADRHRRSSQDNVRLVRALALAKLGKAREARQQYRAARKASVPPAFRRRVEEALKAAG